MYWGNNSLLPPNSLSDGTALFIVRDIRCKYRTGEIVALFGSPKIQDYLLLCDGSQISIELYPELVAVLGNKTLPNLIDGKFLEGWITSGEYKDAGLPNIEGSFKPGINYENTYFGKLAAGIGAFGTKNIGKTGYILTNSSGTYDQFEMIFDASKSNPIYG